MKSSGHLVAIVALMVAAGFAQAQTQMDPAAAGASGAAQSHDPIVQKRQADADAKTEYKAEKKAATKNYKEDKKAAKQQLKREKVESSADRKDKLQADPIARPTP
ncbi:MAG: hypothetical protein JWP38_1456 [Herbaspirillum sp.]|nr:hypothetical protein [Herbaspirillum sp.]